MNLLHTAASRPRVVGLADVPRRSNAGYQLLLEPHGIFDLVEPKMQNIPAVQA